MTSDSLILTAKRLFWPVVIVLVIGITIGQITRNNSLASATLTPTLYPTNYPLLRQTYEVGLQQTADAYRLTPQTPVFIFPPATEPITYLTPEGTPAAAGVITEKFPRFQRGLINAWFSADGTVIVYAGGDDYNPLWGIIVVQRNTGNGSFASHQYRSPIDDGPVRIMSAQNGRLTLESLRGATFYFDVLGEKFTPSLDEVVATVTPAATATPAPTYTPAHNDDAPNDQWTVTQNSRINTNLSYSITSANDADWFRFHADTAGTVIVELKNLPANYDLYVYSSTDPNLQVSSHNSGQADEQVTLPNVPGNDYYVAVAGADSSTFSTTPYSLRFLVDRTPPSLALSVTPTTLWPPDHKLIPIQLSAQATDDFDPNPVVQLVSVTSSEPDDGLGDGDKPGDIVINPDGTIQLRAERSGNGNGRIYTITYSAADRAGNVTTQSVTVTAPHDQ